MRCPIPVAKRALARSHRYRALAKRVLTGTANPARSSLSSIPREDVVAIANLQDLFLQTLEDLYFAETTIVTKLQTRAEKADNAQLRATFETHLAETREHVTRLEQVFDALGEPPRGDESPAIEGITEQAEELVQEIDDADTRDAAMLAAAQAV